jgi:DNA-binding XRE family transcriptional regulator
MVGSVYLYDGHSISSAWAVCLPWDVSHQEGNHIQEDLAHDAGITVAALARIERGQANARWTTIKSIASALGISLGELGEAVDGSH